MLPAQRRVQLHRTFVQRVPEVMVKVSGGGKTVGHVKAHMDYITRNGQLEAVNDQGEKVSGKDDVKDLFDSWDLDAGDGQGKKRQAFNIVLSMPTGTDSNGLFKAVQNFAREEFFGQHQYLMVLHTPETDSHKNAPPHPHVHLVVKAEGFDSKRLYIRKATLEHWRTTLAERLCEQGIEANATPRDLRGQTRKSKRPGVYFAEKRGTSTVLKSKFEEARHELQKGEQATKPWEVAIVNRRRATVRRLLGAADELRKEGDEAMATAIERFAKEMPRPDTERHQIKRAIVNQVERQRSQQPSQQQDADRNDKER
ncbi:relaxase/mobilization nuclease domain-containing protein (plasmid) [Xylella fastidiosa subsp. pauca]